MSRADDLALLHEYCDSESLIKHMLAVEAAVRAYARKFGEDEEKWGTVGLLHDFDYQRWPNAPDHPLQGAAILKMPFPLAFLSMRLHSAHGGISRLISPKRPSVSCLKCGITTQL